MQTSPPCGHSHLRSACQECERFRRWWYRKIHEADPDWKDIEYGYAERLFETVDTAPIDDVDTGDELAWLTSDYYDRVLEISRVWQASGRRRRDCVVAELLGSQSGKSGTVRGICKELRALRLKPRSIGAVHRTIKEINKLVLSAEQGRLSVEQPRGLYLLDSTPKDEADGELEQEQRQTDPSVSQAA